MPKKPKLINKENLQKLEEENSKEEEKSEKTATQKPKKLTQAEYETQVIELAKHGLTSEKIGETLKKKGIHSKDHPIKISKILKKKELYIIPEIKNLSEKLEKIKKHSEKYKQDKKAIREKEKIFSKLRKLRKYHKME